MLFHLWKLNNTCSTWKLVAMAETLRLRISIVTLCRIWTNDKNRNKQTKYLITFGRPSLCKWNTINVTNKYFLISYHKDKTIGKLRSVPVILDLTLFRFFAWRSTLCDVSSLLRFLSLVYWIFFSTSYATVWPKKLIMGKILKGATWERSLWQRDYTI